ncbi:efflux RND transporter periplasmic adaptor subunit [Sphingobacterium sp. lm-10]|uniref:efflux RND transporter periplasmic adaptor subunit n=1 Tax=Sphingobacterium sp. lm-10 TaxID=2944904 RepID=UPI002020C853|nr:efflux RND transporter periplasmic adaptor subunit [Sphingobacterium sp. lm-10]MCL7986864.1 efflux RND transporter periplasmic adaptor subunit [Sphingobacterium sp. lm-10]
MRNRIFAWVLSMSTLSMMAACSASSNENDTEKKTTRRSIPVTHLIEMDTTVYKQYIADIQAFKNVEMRSRLTGFLESIHVDEGAQVRKGQVLFRLNSDEYKAELAKATALRSSAQADAKKIELEIERTKKLVDKNIVSETEYELLAVQLRAAKAKIAEADAMVQQAQTQLSFAQIRAPFDGRINRILLKEGSLLNEGSLLTTISDLSQVNVYFDISESEYLTLAKDSNFNRNSYRKEVQLLLANGDRYPSKGFAEIVESEFESQTGSISLRARFPNEKLLLSHGASGKIAVPLATGNLLFVHQKCVLEIQDKVYVYVLQDDNTIKMTPFKAGQRVGHFYVVNSGLNANDQVVYEGVQSLRDGMTINPKVAKFKENED